MSKYDPLTRHLKGRYGAQIPMTFVEIEKVLDSKLPRSAHEYAAWWANHPGETHVQAKAWMDAGFETTEVDRDRKRVVFARVAQSTSRAAEESPREFATANGILKSRRHPLFGAMKGTFWVDPDWDLTKPSLGDDEMAEWEASLDKKADRIEAGMRRKP